LDEPLPRLLCEQQGEAQGNRGDEAENLHEDGVVVFVSALEVPRSNRILLIG
jgi:hypothetical protein